MNIRRESVYSLVRRIARGRRFSMAGYSDAEWRCILGGEWAGTTTALGQVIDPAHGRRLLDVLRRRAADPAFLVAVPACLYAREGPGGTFLPGLPGFAEGQVDWLLGREDLTLPHAVERDCLLDDLAAAGGLYPWVRQFRRMHVCLIGPAPLRGLRDVVPYARFVEVESPNLHLSPDGIERAVRAAEDFDPGGSPPAFLVSAGVSAALIVDRLHDRTARTGGWALDMGSVWDAFVGIGGQRAWRAELYADPARLEKWKADCTRGIDGRGW